MPRPTVWHRLNQELRTTPKLHWHRFFFYYYLLFQHNKHEQNIYSNTIKIKYIHCNHLLLTRVLTHFSGVEFPNFQPLLRHCCCFAIFIHIFLYFISVTCLCVELEIHMNRKVRKEKMKVKVKENILLIIYISVLASFVIVLTGFDGCIYVICFLQIMITLWIWYRTQHKT